MDYSNLRITAMGRNQNHDTHYSWCFSCLDMVLRRQHLFVFECGDLPGAKKDVLYSGIFPLPGLQPSVVGTRHDPGV